MQRDLRTETVGTILQAWKTLHAAGGLLTLRAGVDAAFDWLRTA